MGQMKLDKRGQAIFRQKKILELISKPGGMSCTRLARKLNVPRGTIINDIRDLRAMGYPVQTSMTVEEKMYSALFELTKSPRWPF